jgi:hypothetical protein
MLSKFTCKSPGLLIGTTLFIALAALPLHAMDRWEALSQVESGNNDKAVGAAGEISRYQIKPEVWRRYAKPKANWENPDDSLSVAKEIMRERCADFEASFRRPPSDREFYILWNAPATIKRPGKAVIKRAERFSNLIARRDQRCNVGKAPSERHVYSKTFPEITAQAPLGAA